MIQYKVSYCKFGFDYRKNTHIWSNDKRLAELLPEACSRHHLCDTAKMNGGKHPVGVRARPGQKSVGNDVTSAKAKLWERYRQPGGLWSKIFRFPDELEVQTVGDGVEAESVADTLLLDASTSTSDPEPEPEPEPEQMSMGSDASSSWWG